MPSLKQTNQIIEESQAIKDVSEALGEVAALKFKATRSYIEQSSFFFGEVAKVYQAIKMIAAKKNLTEHSKLDKNNRTVCLLLTSNAQFYGGLDVEVSEHFIKSTINKDIDRVVIGQTGIKYLNDSQFKGKFVPIILNKDMPTSSELTALVGSLNRYSRILVFHSKFVTVLNQEVEIANVNGQITSESTINKDLDYILEPEISQMMVFFESQILVSLIQSLFLQSELARTAARMVSMDQAELNSERQIEKQRSDLLKLKKGLQNLRILETYTSIRNIL